MSGKSKGRPSLGECRVMMHAANPEPGRAAKAVERVRAVLEDGTEEPCTPFYAGREDGVDVWDVTVPEGAVSVLIGVLPARSAVRVLRG